MKTIHGYKNEVQRTDLKITWLRISKSSLNSNLQHIRKFQMKKLFLSVAAMIAINMSGPALAADEMVTMDGKNILLTLVEAKGNLDGKLHSKDLPNGIFVRVSDNSFPVNGASLPNAEALVKAIFVAHGFKVVDKAEGASVAVQFGSVGGSFNLVSANNQAEHGSVSSDKVVGTIVVAAVGGGAGVLGAVASLFIQTDERTSLMGFVSIKPEYKGPNFLMSSEKNDHGANLLVKYRLEKENKAQDDIILKVMIEQWIKQYMVKESDVAKIATPASAVAAADQLVNTKK
jgi:hypothetical protein